MPFLPEDDAGPEFNPLRPMGKPEGMIVTRDEFSPPVSDFPNVPGASPRLAAADTFGEKGTPSWSDTLGASFRLENEVAGFIRQQREQRDFGPADEAHNPWDTIQGTKYQEYWKSFVTSRNGAETEAIRAKIDEELEARRIREASGAAGFATDVLASLASPTTLIPGGGIYKGYKVGSAALRSASSVAALAAAGVTVQELMLQQQQITRSWTESLLNIGGGTILGGLLGGGLSFAASRGLARASAQIDLHTARVARESELIDAGLRFDELEALAKERVLSIEELAERAALKAKIDEPPFGSSGGAALSREIQENVPKGAFGVEKVFAGQGPLTHVLGGTVKTARDVMTRLAEIPLSLKQNAKGIATGPAGGSVESRIKVDGDVAIYRAQEALYKGFAEYRFGAPSAKLAQGRAAFADMMKPKQGRLDFKEFKRQVTAALRAETKDGGIEHPVPQVKAAAEAFRREVFEPFKKEAIKLGMFDKEAEFSWNYVMRRWDIEAIMRDMPRFRQILFDHLKGGQAAALAELDKLRGEIDALIRSGDLMPEVAGLARAVEDVRQRFAVDQGTVDSVMDMWRLVQKEKPKKPLSLTEWLKKEGGIRDDGRSLEHILGSRKEAGRLISKNGMTLDDAGLAAFQKGYFNERPHINELLDAIDDDVRSGGTTHFSKVDDEAVETWRVAEDYRTELENYGIAGITSEKQARKIVTQQLRAESAAPAVKSAREGIEADREFLDGLTKADAPDTPEGRAAVEDARQELETRIADAEQSIKRMGEDDEPLFAGGAPVSLIRKMVGNGKKYVVSDAAIERQFDAVEPFVDLLPEGSRFGAWASVGPSARGDEFATATFSTLTGTVRLDIPLEHLAGARAMYVPNLRLIVASGIGNSGSEANIASGIYHELVHANWRGLAVVDRIRLATHAENLQVLDMQLGTVLRIVGNSSWKDASNVTLREVYSKLYANDPRALQDLLDQEAVAHMQELHYAGHLSDAEVDPVLPDLLNMRGGARGMSADTSTDMPMFAIQADKASGQAMKRELDALGFYSAALEAARKFQNKGTPEQAMAWLKKSGVKDAEIKATKTAEFMEGKASVTRDELVAHLQANRVELNEKTSRVDVDDPANPDADFGVDETTFSNYSLRRFDPQNTTYAETRLFIPDPRQARLDEMEAREADLSRQIGRGNSEVQEEFNDLHDAAAKLRADIERDTVGSHFAERNVVGHMQTTIQTHQGKPVFTLNQVQSDWGQSIRDRGEAGAVDTDALRRGRDAAEATARELAAKGNSMLPSGLRYEDPSRSDLWRQLVNDLDEQAERILGSPMRRVLQSGLADRLQKQAQELSDAVNTIARLDGEIRSSSGAPIGHPLVGSTDQWVNTTLRRAIRQAVEADADYIAIPTGDTVLSYNPGDKNGMREFYGAKATSEDDIANARAEFERLSDEHYGRGRDPMEPRPFRGHEMDAARDRLMRLEDRGTGQTGIVPKNLRNLLAKIDKDVKPELVDTLDSPVAGGPKGLGDGFTIFPLTDKIKMAMKGDDGLPMFAVGGEGAALPPADKVDLGFSTVPDGARAQFDEMLARPAALRDIRALDGLARELDKGNLAEALAKAAQEPRPADPPMMVYHGTEKDFKKFNVDVARANSDTMQNFGVDAVFVTPSKAFSEGYGTPVPLELKSGFYFDVENMGDLARLAPFINSRPNAARFWKKLEDGGQTWGMLEGPDVAAEVKRLGYDGIVMSEQYHTATNVRLAQTIAVFTEGKVVHRGTDDVMFAAAPRGADEPEAPTIPRELVEQATALAERMGVKMPDELATMDLDDAMKALGGVLESMDNKARVGANKTGKEVQDLVDKAGELKKFAEADDQELMEIVKGTIAKLTGSPVARNIHPFDPMLKEGKSGPLHARTLKIPDAKVVDFLDDDIERIGLHYVRSMAPDVALTREFGDMNLTEDLQRVQDEIDTRLASAATYKERKAIEKEGRRTIKDIQGVVARLRGTQNIAHDPTSWGPRAATAVKQLNVLRLMGAVLAASISDVPKLLFTHGFRQNADMLADLVTNYSNLRMAKAEAKEMSAGLEFVMSRAGQMWDTFDDIAGHTMPERALRYATNKMGRLNLMDAWNSNLKQLSGAMTSNRVLRASLDLVNGRISPRDLDKLAQSGIDADLARVIADQYKKHGDVHGRLMLANVNAWDETSEAMMGKQALMAAVRREADLTVTTPGQEKPLWLSTHLGSVLGQFRTFQLTSIQRTLIAGLQEADAAKVVALTGMIGLGMLSEQLKMLIHGKEKKNGPKDMGEWLYAGLANSGALGWLTDADQTMHKVSGGNVSVGKFAFGNDRAISRFASQNVVGSLLGPTFGAATDVGRSAGAIMRKEGMTEGDVHAMRRLLPYQNLFYISRSLRAFEEGMIDAMGIPRAQQRN